MRLILKLVLFLVGASFAVADVTLTDILVPVDATVYSTVPTANTVKSVTADGGVLTVVTRGASAVESTTTISLGSGGPTSGLNQAAVDARIRALVPVQSVVVGLTEFEAALRYEAPLVTGAGVTVALGDAAYRIPGNPKLPDVEPGRQIVVRVTNGGQLRFNLASLRNKPAISTIPTQLSSTNAVQWSNGGVLYQVARHSDGEFLFSADTIGAYSVTIIESSVALQPGARRSATNPTISERARDAVGSALVAGEDLSDADIDVTVNDSANTITLSVKDGEIDPAELRFNAGQLVGGRLVRLAANAAAFETVAHGGLEELHDGTITGLTLSSTNADATQSPTLTSPLFDLDDHPHGEFHVCLLYASPSPRD